jgi:hypothetical protein
MIHNHHPGETFAEWLAMSNLNLSNCLNKHNKPRGEYCKELIAVRDTGHLPFTPYMTSMPTFNKDNLEWTFFHGKAATAELTRDLRSIDASEEVNYLKQAYGPPTVEGFVTVQNAYGAKWDLYSGTWNMPDGVNITAVETKDPDSTVFPFTLHVKFTSAEEYQSSLEYQKRKAADNPYKK